MNGWRFRVGEGGALVLQVHAEKPAPYPATPNETRREWRDAKVEDIPVAEMFTPPGYPLTKPEWAE